MTLDHDFERVRTSVFCRTWFEGNTGLQKSKGNIWFMCQSYAQAQVCFNPHIVCSQWNRSRCRFPTHNGLWYDLSNKKFFFQLSWYQMGRILLNSRSLTDQKHKLTKKSQRNALFRRINLCRWSLPIWNRQQSSGELISFKQINWLIHW